jgi:hypothetical protein
MNVKCSCNICSQHLEFDQSAAGSTVACPHCGMDTVLFIPPPLASPVPPPVVQDDGAKLFSLQNRLFIANAIQVFGWVGCVGSLLGCLAVLTDSENSVPFSPFTVGLVAVSFSVAAGILALYGLARGKKLRRELAPIAKRVQEEVALRNAELAREKAHPRSAKYKRARQKANSYQFNINNSIFLWFSLGSNF